ncbi:MAG: hypothetical protein ABMA26_17175 [Limisphaerales bacterium]
MTVVADDKSRLQLRRWDVMPGDVWAVEPSGPRRIVLVKLERPVPKLGLLDHLRALSGLELPERKAHCPPRT